MRSNGGLPPARHLLKLIERRQRCHVCRRLGGLQAARRELIQIEPQYLHAIGRHEQIELEIL